MSKLPRYFQKNKVRFEKIFTNFDEDVTYIRQLAGDTEEILISGIISQQNPVSFENYNNYDIEVKILNRDKPSTLSIDDEIRIEATGEVYAIDSIRVENVTTTLECTATS